VKEFEREAAAIERQLQAQQLPAQAMPAPGPAAAPSQHDQTPAAAAGPPQTAAATPVPEPAQSAEPLEVEMHIEADPPPEPPMAASSEKEQQPEEPVKAEPPKKAKPHKAAAPHQPEPKPQRAPEKKVETTPAQNRSSEEPSSSIVVTQAAAAVVPIVVIPEESYDDKVQALVSSAVAAEAQGADKGIEAWRKVVQAAPDKRRPRRELGRLYRTAERWNALIEVLKEEAERTSGEDKVAVLFEMVEVYRERLKLDVMVVNTYGQILQLAPKNVLALDSLATQYEAMKRWPDLIGTLQKRAPLSADPIEKVQLYLRIAGLFQEKFSNQAEAIKAYEAALELDSTSDQALGYLKQAYEKRRDWEKLVGVHLREIERVPEGDRGPRYVEVAKLASEKLKKPAISIDLWKRVLSAQPDHVEALAELEKLYEREKAWDDLAAVLEKQAQSSPDAQKRAPVLQKLGLLYTEKVKQPQKAMSAWQRLLEAEPENRRAQDALKKLYLEQKAWDELEQFYAAQQKWDEFIRVIERQVDSEDASSRLALHMKIANMYRDRLGKPDRAMRAYERVLSLEANHVGAAEALIPLYEQAGDAKKLGSVLSIQLGHTTDPTARQERLQRLATLFEAQLRDKGAAFAHWLKLFAERPDREDVRQQVERLAGETAGFAELVAAYETALAAGSGPELPLLATVAHVYERELVQPDKAIETSRRILAAAPDDANAVAALERLYLATEKWDALLEIYARKLELAKEPAEKKEIRYRVAHLYEEEAQDRGKAIGAYEAILAENGDELQALRALDRIHVAHEMWRELAAVLPRELTLVEQQGGDPAQIVELKFRLGELSEKHLGDPATAIECYRDILQLDAGHDGARRALERTLEDSAQQLEAARILEPIYERLEEWRKLIEVHEIQLGREREKEGKVKLLLRIGELYASKLMDADKAFSAFARCFREDPQAAAARAELERLAAIQDGWEPLVGLYERAVEKGGIDAPLARELMLKTAAAYDEKLDKADKAVEYYRRTLAIDHDDVQALDALEKLYTRNEKWPELLDVYRRKAELANQIEERQRLLFQMAYLQEEMLSAVDDAVVTYKEILSLDDRNIKALHALDRLYQHQQAWHELADNLARQLALTEAREAQVQLLIRLADLREQRLGEVAAAIDTYRQVLEQDPQNNEAAKALERLIALPEHELVVATILEPIWQARDEWRKLVDVYEIMARHALDPAAKIQLLHKIGELYEIGGDDASLAFQTYGRALREDPGLAESQGRFERLARILDRWEEAVALYRELVGQITDEEHQVALWMKIARLYEEQLKQDEHAAEAYGNVLEVAPRSLDAANALEQIYVRAGAYKQLVEVVARKADIVEDVALKKELLFRTAQIHEDVLEDLDSAITVFRHLLSLDDTDTGAIDALERLYTRLERWDQLKDVYRKKADLARSTEDKKQLFFVLGQVYDSKLHDVERAIETYQTILDLDAADWDAISALDRLFQQASRWYDLLQILEREVELARGAGETVQVKHRIGALWEHELNDFGRAVESYRAVLAMDSQHEPTLAALDRIVHGDTEPVAAARVLEPIYETGGDWDKLVDVYEVMVVHAEDGLRRIELLHKIADICERRIENGRAAFLAQGRALREDSAREDTLAALERLAEQTGAWDDLARLYDEEVDKILEPARQVAMLLRQARVHEEERGAVDRAIVTFRRVLELDVDNRQAVTALDRLYTGGERWAELADVLRAEIRLAEGSEQQVIDTTFRLGQVYEQALHEPKHAIECYREILAMQSDHMQTLSALELLFAEGTEQVEIGNILEPLYRAGEQWEKLIKIYEVQLEKVTEPAERMSLVSRIGELSELKLGDTQTAFVWWGRLLREQPLSEVAAEEVERHARTIPAWDDLVALYLDVAEQASDPHVQRSVLLRAGRVYEDEMSDRVRAEEVYLRALALDERDADALRALDRIYDASGMFRELSEILRRRLGVTDDSAELVELYFRLARVYADALDEPDQAVECLNAVLEADSRNARALEALERVYFKRQAWLELYGIYEKMIDIAEGDGGMADCYARMAKIASEALGEPDRAMDLWGRVTDLRGEDPTAIWALADLYERGGMWSELVSALERGVKLAETPLEQVRIFKRLGRVFGERLGKDRQALDNWLRALEIEPNDAETLRALSVLYRNTQAWEELVDALHRLIELGITQDANEVEQKELYAQLGELQGEILMRPQDAIEAWNHVLRIDEQEFRALAALERLYTQEARWEECIAVLQRKAEVVETPVEQIDVLLQSAQVWQDKLSQRDNAAQVYERVLGIDAANLTASIQLEEIYRESGHWEKLIELLLGRVEHTQDAAQRIEILQGVARTYEAELKQPDAAFVALQAAFREDYANDSTAKELERLASATGKWNDLLTEYTQVVQTIAEPQVAADLWVKIGRWYGEELGHVDYAIASEQQALALAPSHLGAMSALADFYRKAGRWPELVAILGRHAELEEDLETKLDLLLSMADLWENQLGDANQAVAAYRMATEVDAGCLDALNALERLYQRMSRWDDLVDILGKKTIAIDDTEQVLRIKHQIGAIWEEQLDDATRAIDTYKDILTVDPQNLAALQKLEKLYERTGQMEAYLDILEQQLDVTGTEAERISLYERMAMAWEEQFGKPERAWECYEKILLIDSRRETTYRALERIYRDQRRWEELVETYRKHIGAISDRDERMELYALMGQVYEEELKEPERAIEAYNDILAFDPDHLAALAALGRLYEKTEEWDPAIERMSQLGQLTTDAALKVDLHYRIGRIYDERISDPDTAESRYMEALALDTTHVPTMLALIRMYDRRGDWLKSGGMRVRAENETANAIEKTRLLFDAAKIYHERLEDEGKAAELYARILEIDPEHAGAGEPLADIYFKEARWQELEPVLDMLVRKIDRKDNRELNQLYYRMARTADELNNGEKALRYYKLAYDLDSTFLPTLLGRAALLYKMEEWDQAFKIYQTILVHHRDAQREGDIVDIFYRLGQIKLKLGERKKGLNMFEKALEVDPNHRATLQAVMDLQAQQNDWEAVIHAKRSLMNTAQTDERFALLHEIGDIYREKLGNAQKSIGSYMEALEVKPKDHVTQHKLLELYTETKQWKKSVEVMLLVIDGETDPKRRAKYWYTAAVINRDELRSLDDAIEYFNQALDDDPDLLKAFEAIDKICTSRREWKQQERNYRKMIKRTTAQPETEERKTALIALWHALGEIYRSRLKDYASAMAAFEVASGLEPENATRHEILAELYQLVGGDAMPKAIREHQTLIKANPFKIESFKALRKIYMDTRQYDKAWCVCAALAFLKKADAEEQQFFEQYRQRGFVRAKQRLTDELWAKGIFHPDEDRFIGAIFAAIWQPAALLRSAPHKNFGLKRKDKLDVASNQLLFAKVFNYVNQVLNVPQPELYLRPEQPIAMQLANAQEKGILIPSFVVGSDLLQGRPEKELAFTIARTLTYLRPEHYLKLALLTNTDLKTVFHAALRLVNPKIPVKGDPAVIDQYVQAMARGVNPAWIEQLAMVVKKFFETRTEADLGKFATAVELTAARAGFILCNDLDVAAKMVSQEPVAVGGMQAKDKIKELMLYSLSEEYFAVRQHLGLAIG
jgi:tetratricopeptide (TPR) repeat protein